MDKNDLYKSLSLNLIFREVGTIKSIVQSPNKKEHSIIMLSWIPFLSTVVVETMEYMKNFEIDASQFLINTKERNVLNKTRAKIKVYNKKGAKNLKELNKILNTHNEIFSTPLRFQKLKKHGFYYDFGAYKSNSYYIGNTFLYNWYFQDISSFEDISDEKIKDDLFNFSKLLGQWIGFLDKLNTHENKIGETYTVFPKINSVDFNLTDKPTKLFRVKEDTSINLFLFNLICQGNFQARYLNTVFINNETLYIRSLYLSYFYICSSLETLKIYSSHSKKNINIDFAYLDTLTNLKNTDFCNCIRHYGITEKDLFLSEINLEKNFYGLIEKHFNIEEKDFTGALQEKIIGITEYLENSILI